MLLFESANLALHVASCLRTKTPTSAVKILSPPGGIPLDIAYVTTLTTQLLYTVYPSILDVDLLEAVVARACFGSKQGCDMKSEQCL